MSLVDLSQPIYSGMQVYPGDPQVRLSPALTVIQDGVAVTELHLGSHTGTHLDAPSHVLANGNSLAQTPLSWCWGEAYVIHAPQMLAAAIDLTSLEQSLPESMPDVVLINTGWDIFFGTERALAHPWLTREAAELLWSRGARLLGVDTLSPDPTQCPADGNDTKQATSAAPTTFPVHDYWLGHGGIIVENLRSLSLLSDRCEVSLLPLSLGAIDGSPIRAVARNIS